MKELLFEILYVRPEACPEADFQAGYCLQRGPGIPAQNVGDSRGRNAGPRGHGFHRSEQAPLSAQINDHGLNHLVLRNRYIETVGPARVAARGTAWLRSYHVTTVAPGTSNVLLGVVVATLGPEVGFASDLVWPERCFERRLGRRDGMDRRPPLAGNPATEHRLSNAGPLSEVFLRSCPATFDIPLNLAHECLSHLQRFGVDGRKLRGVDVRPLGVGLTRRRESGHAFSPYRGPKRSPQRNPLRGYCTGSYGGQPMSLTPQEREYVERRVSGYTPQFVSETTWATVAAVVREIALEAFEAGGADHFHLRQDRHSEVSKYLRSLTYVAAYCHRVGRPVDRETVLDVDVCRAALNDLAQTHRNTATVRTYLNKITMTLTGKSISLQPREPKEQAKPYAQRDFDALRHWVQSQATTTKREQAFTVLALGLGAGICDGMENVLADDVSVRDGVTWVHVERLRGAGYAPEVPVASVFGPGLAAVAEAKDPGEPLLPYGDINDLVKKELNWGRSFKVSLRRLRVTWAVQVIRAVPREVAVAAIGTTHVGDFERLARVDPERPDNVEDHVEALTDPYVNWPGLASSAGAVGHWGGDGSRAGFGGPKAAQDLDDHPRTGERKSTEKARFEFIDGGAK